MSRMKVYLLLGLLLNSLHLPAQQLSFGHPIPVFPGASSDRSPAVALFRETCFMAWKTAGITGAIQVGSLGRPSANVYPENYTCIQGAVSAYAPAFCSTDDRLYLFWIAADSTLQYMIHTAAAGLEQAAIHTLATNQPARFALGLNAAMVDGKLILAAHSGQKDKLTLVVCVPGNDGLLGTAEVLPVKGAKSGQFPLVTALKDGLVARVIWPESKKKRLYYADYTPGNDTWLPPQMAEEGATTEITPAAGILSPANELFYFWKSSPADGRLWYGREAGEGQESRATALPRYFDSPYPIAVGSDGNDGLMMSYTGTDQRLYLSYFYSYNPATWMADQLFPAKENYSLKDIVLPGSHDAGMSVLNGTGGKKKEVVNDCNTLTQVLPIEKQLNAGIRMFDLRTEQYEGVFYTKHAPSDCMEDALAGGYGEKLDLVLKAVKQFLTTNNKEIVLLSFCHLCDRNISLEEQAKFIAHAMGKDMIFYAAGRKLETISLRELAGKAIITFENYAVPEVGVDVNTMTNESSQAFINYRREYAATHQLSKLIPAQQAFFNNLKGNIQPNDLVRLDWQLTEDPEEAASICNDFQSENTNPLLDMALLLVNTVGKHKSIIDLATTGNRHLPVKIKEWIDEGTINKANRPNILYVDAADNWITDFCISLNKEKLYEQ